MASTLFELALQAYSSQVVDFLTINEVLWNFAWKDFLTHFDRKLYEVDRDWIEYFKQISVFDWRDAHQQMPPMSKSAPDSLRTFLQQCHAFSLGHRLPATFEDFDLTLKGHNVKMKLKKQHEVAKLCPLINYELRRHEGIGEIVDVGAGNCYIEQHLRSINSSVQLTVIERDVDKSKRISGSSIDSKLQYIESDIRSSEHLVSILDSSRRTEEMSYRKTKKLLFGLHSCGDLSVNMIRAFADSSECGCLLLLSCCYHKIFDNKQPLSLSRLSFLFDNVNGLRLACQQNLSQWPPSDIEFHLTNVTYRTILEQFRPNERLGCPRRNESIVSYAKRILKTDNIDLSQLCECFQQFKYRYLVTAVFYLQYHLQSVLETCILIDRFVYLRARLHGSGCDVRLVRIFDDAISCRNIALIAHK